MKEQAATNLVRLVHEVGTVKHKTYLELLLVQVACMLPLAVDNRKELH